LATLSSPAAIVIASDQVAALGNEILTKPGTMTNAKTQLQACSGQQVTFYTSLFVSDSQGLNAQQSIIPTRVDFRQLSNAQIENYLIKETPFDCAGSFKVEGLGITLFDRIISEDPTALIGLPMIALTTALQTLGADPLS